jgi:hypothetical protein
MAQDRFISQFAAKNMPAVASRGQLSKIPMWTFRDA